ncbi:MAG: hypothetical protein JXE06_01530 [Coriobacteriia bacterium]|nr:hypothetical protein [Coriobacteriia bacterium]
MTPGFIRELREGLPVSERAVVDADAGLRIDVPVASNKRFIVGAVLFGFPWLTTMLAISVFFLAAAPIDPILIRVLAWFVAMALLIFIHILAAMSVWGAFYQARGSETLVIDDEFVRVLRTGMGITLPAKVGRGGKGSASVLPQWYKKAPQPKIEVKTSRGAVRFGAGVTFVEAAAIAHRINEFFLVEEEVRALTERHDLG